jgi:hypothetical protein
MFLAFFVSYILGHILGKFRKHACSILETSQVVDRFGSNVWKIQQDHHLNTWHETYNFVDREWFRFNNGICYITFDSVPTQKDCEGFYGRVNKTSVSYHEASHLQPALVRILLEPMCLSVYLRKVVGLSPYILYDVSGFSLPPIKSDHHHIIEKLLSIAKKWQTKRQSFVWLARKRKISLINWWNWCVPRPTFLAVLSTISCVTKINKSSLFLNNELTISS